MTDHYLGMINSSVSKVCVCKIRSVVFCCCCCSAIFIHSPHIKDTILISLIHKGIVGIVSSILQWILLSYFLSTFVSFAKYFLTELEGFPFINLPQSAGSKLLSFFFCINKGMLTSHWTKTSAFNDSTRMKLLRVDAFLSSFPGRYLHARVI